MSEQRDPPILETVPEEVELPAPVQPSAAVPVVSNFSDLSTEQILASDPKELIDKFPNQADQITRIIQRGQRDIEAVPVRREAIQLAKPVKEKRTENISQFIESLKDDKFATKVLGRLKSQILRGSKPNQRGVSISGEKEDILRSINNALQDVQRVQQDAITDAALTVVDEAPIQANVIPQTVISDDAKSSSDLSPEQIANSTPQLLAERFPNERNTILTTWRAAREQLDRLQLQRERQASINSRERVVSSHVAAPQVFVIRSIEEDVKNVLDDFSDDELQGVLSLLEQGRDLPEALDQFSTTAIMKGLLDRRIQSPSPAEAVSPIEIAPPITRDEALEDVEALKEIQRTTGVSLPSGSTLAERVVNLKERLATAVSQGTISSEEAKIDISVQRLPLPDIPITPPLEAAPPLEEKKVDVEEEKRKQFEEAISDGTAAVANINDEGELQSLLNDVDVELKEIQGRLGEDIDSSSSEFLNTITLRTIFDIARNKLSALQNQRLAELEEQKRRLQSQQKPIVLSRRQFDDVKENQEDQAIREEEKQKVIAQEGTIARRVRQRSILDPRHRAIPRSSLDPLTAAVKPSSFVTPPVTPPVRGQGPLLDPISGEDIKERKDGLDEKKHDDIIPDIEDVIGSDIKNQTIENITEHLAARDIGAFQNRFFNDRTIQTILSTELQSLQRTGTFDFNRVKDNITTLIKRGLVAAHSENPRDITLQTRRVIATLGQSINNISNIIGSFIQNGGINEKVGNEAITEYSELLNNSLNKIINIDSVAGLPNAAFDPINISGVIQLIFASDLDKLMDRNLTVNELQEIRQIFSNDLQRFIDAQEVALISDDGGAERLPVDLRLFSEIARWVNEHVKNDTLKAILIGDINVATQQQEQNLGVHLSTAPPRLEPLGLHRLSSLSRDQNFRISNELSSSIDNFNSDGDEKEFRDAIDNFNTLVGRNNIRRNDTGDLATIAVQNDSGDSKDPADIVGEARLRISQLEKGDFKFLYTPTIIRDSSGRRTQKIVGDLISFLNKKRIRGRVNLNTKARISKHAIHPVKRAKLKNLLISRGERRFKSRGKLGANVREITFLDDATLEDYAKVAKLLTMESGALEDTSNKVLLKIVKDTTTLKDVLEVLEKEAKKHTGKTYSVIFTPASLVGGHFIDGHMMYIMNSKKLVSPDKGGIIHQPRLSHATFTKNHRDISATTRARDLTHANMSLGGGLEPPNEQSLDHIITKPLQESENQIYTFQPHFSSRALKNKNTLMAMKQKGGRIQHPTFIVGAIQSSGWVDRNDAFPWLDLPFKALTVY